MKYNDAIAYLYALQKHGIKLGLDNTRRLLSLLGNPQDVFRAIHVAGTNGKGSTAAIIASVLRSAGFTVGLFTSPHLVSFTERIRVDGIEIKEQEVVELTGEMRAVIERNVKADIPVFPHPSLPGGRQGGGAEPFSPTFFEFVTAMAFLYFKRKEVEWAVVETGMGGRLDATNILSPAASVITRVCFDHREFLGQTLRAIAGEKAGIIKKGVPSVSSAQEPEALEMIEARASAEGSELFVFGRDFTSRLVQSDMRGITFDYQGEERFDNLRVPLCGMHQIENASVAVKAVELIMEKESVSPQSIREGLAHTTWHGRLELIKGEGRHYDLLVDGAHNPSASQALAEALRRYFVPAYKEIILILGIMADKDIEGIMGPLLPIASEVIFTAPAYERAASPEKLAQYAQSSGFVSTVTHSVKEALDKATKRTERSPAPEARHLIVITGSFYTIGEAKIVLGHKGVLTGLRE
ncbi:MAG: folylpolyglutamate synthase/dihydrofolate synthase family protein [Thermodesulfovibrionales bacterium]|jgi:dihydrofolate synthase/folylpolyglutamate synthase